VNYFVTGGTGSLGRHLVGELLNHRQGHVYLLLEGSPTSTHLHEQFGFPVDRVTWMPAMPGEDEQVLSRSWLERLQGQITHFFHLAGAPNLVPTKFAETEVEPLTATRSALRLAQELDVSHFHHLSSVAVAGDHAGVFDESMYDEGQGFPSHMQESLHQAEGLVRNLESLDWRIYRPGIIVGNSVTGEMDSPSEPYLFFPVLKLMRDRLPNWTPLIGIDFGDTNIVPVDHVAHAMDYLAHAADQEQQTFHLVNPQPQPLLEIANTLASAARAPRFAIPLDRRLTARLPLGLLSKKWGPGNLTTRLLRQPWASAVLDQSVGRLGIPAEVLLNASLTPVFASRRTQQVLAGAGISPPPFEDYAENLWTYWEEVLDDSILKNAAALRALQGKTVVITGASSGIGYAAAAQLARAGATVILVARGQEKLDQLAAAISRFGGKAHTYTCDLSQIDEIDSLVRSLLGDFERIDFVVNNAGRSIRRSIELSGDRFHDFERTMQLNYFGTIRFVMGLMPRMRAQGGAHVVNISSVGVLGRPPRFSAYVASKAALDAWTDIAASEAIRDHITFTTIHMPLVRTPMISPTKAYNNFTTISPGQAAEKIISALVLRPREINTLTGSTMALIHQAAPKGALQLLNLAYQSLPEPGARQSEYSERTQELVRMVYQKLRW